MQDEWTTQTQIIYDEMIALHMDPIPLYYLISSITIWKTIPTPDHPQFEFDAMYTVLFTKQSKIGWNHVIYRQLTTAWVDIQNQYKHTPDNGITIISTAISKIFKMVYHM